MFTVFLYTEIAALFTALVCLFGMLASLIIEAQC